MPASAASHFLRLPSPRKNPAVSPSTVLACQECFTEEERPRSVWVEWSRKARFSMYLCEIWYGSPKISNRSEYLFVWKYDTPTVYWLITGWWFQTFFSFHNIWDNPSHWRTHIFQDCYCTTNQISIFPLRWLFSSHHVQPQQKTPWISMALRWPCVGNLALETTEKSRSFDWSLVAFWKTIGDELLLG